MGPRAEMGVEVCEQHRDGREALVLPVFADPVSYCPTVHERRSLRLEQKQGEDTYLSRLSIANIGPPAPLQQSTIRILPLFPSRPPSPFIPASTRSSASIASTTPSSTSLTASYGAKLWNGRKRVTQTAVSMVWIGWRRKVGK